MRRIDYIIIHCSATPPQMHIGAAEIDRWHRERGFNGIGYHFVVRVNGVLETGRDLTLPGAHARGYNHNSIGICYVGGLDAGGQPADTRTQAQKNTLASLVTALKKIYPNAIILGHRDLPDVHKDCPCFEVSKWLKDINL